MKWLETIKRHQTFDEARTVYHICRKHFQNDCLKSNGKKIALVSGSVPTIFDEINNFNEINETNSFEEINVLNCFEEQNGSAVAEIKQLENELLQAKLKHDVEKQAMQRQINFLTKQYQETRAKLAELKKRNAQEAKEKKSLNDELSRIKNQVNLPLVI